MRGLYIHIPFCKSICSYCDFPKRLCDPKLYDTYIQRVIEELDYYENELKDIETVYIGGGTPNAISLEALERLFKRIKPYLLNSKENSIELNPELVTEELCDLLFDYNFNRVSLGVETVDPESIKILNRHHNKETIKNAIHLLRYVGIYNINCDLIFGIPYTDLDILKDDLDFVTSLNPTHLSCYSLIIEDKTVLSYQVEKGKIEPLDDDLCADMYDFINDYLRKKGYKHYEVSNYAKLGYESIHNKLYWEEKEYLGIGAGASGFINKIRYTNHRGLNSYFDEFLDDCETITLEAEKNEFMMLGLRLVEGVSITEYQKRYHNSPFDDFPVINQLINRGLLEVFGDNIRIPENKLFLGNIVWSEFV